MGGTALAVFSDADALDLHLDLASSRFAEAYQLVESSDIELLGQPSTRAADLARSFGGRLKTTEIGFARGAEPLGR